MPAKHAKIGKKVRKLSIRLYTAIIMHTCVSLRIIGELDIEEVSRQLGMEPSCFHKKGSRDRFGEKMESDIWTSSDPLDKNERIEQKFDWLLRQFENKYETLRQISSYAKIDIFCGITFMDQGWLFTDSQSTFDF